MEIFQEGGRKGGTNKQTTPKNKPRTNIALATTLRDRDAAQGCEGGFFVVLKLNPCHFPTLLKSPRPNNMSRGMDSPLPLSSIHSYPSSRDCSGCPFPSVTCAQRDGLQRGMASRSKPWLEELTKS